MSNYPPMMYYIRFLKPPRLSLDGNPPFLTIKTLITITTEIGDRFFPGQIRLFAELFGPSGRCLYSSNRFAWQYGMRSLWVEIKIDKLQHVEWPMQMNVSHVSHAAGGIVQNRIAIGSVPWIIDACSDPINSDIDAQVNKRVVRVLTLGPGLSLRMHEDTGDSIARHIWDGGVALSACFSTAVQEPFHARCPLSLKKLLHPIQPRVLRALELGSGCGVAGMTLASLQPNCHMWLTDLPEAMDLLQLNIQESMVAAGSRLLGQVLIWGEDFSVDTGQEQLDLVLVSDCTYNTDSIPALVGTFATLLSQSPAALIVVATKIRHASELVFFDLMANAGIVQVERLTILLPSGCDEEDENADIHFFRHREASAQTAEEMNGPKREKEG